MAELQPVKYLYFLHYNNYANRTFKREDTLSDYLGSSNANVIAVIEDSKLWDPADGIRTVITTPLNTDFTTEPDYFIESNSDNDILSRWFITETVRIRKGQYTCYLKRDVFVEAWDEFLDSTCNINRALLNKYDTLIFNPEPISVNQIISEERLIKDKTGCPWIVFYGPSGTKDYGTQGSPDVQPIHVNPLPDTASYNFVIASKATFEAENQYAGLVGLGQNSQFSFAYRHSYSTLSSEIKLNPNSYHWEGFQAGETIPDNCTPYMSVLNWDTATANTNNYLAPALAPYLTACRADLYINVPAGTTFLTANEYAAKRNMAGQRCYCTGDSKLYQIVWHNGTDKNIDFKLTEDTRSDAVYNLLISKFISLTNIPNYINLEADPLDKSSFKFNIRTLQNGYMTLEEVVSDDVTATLPTAFRTKDSPYYTWCMPYGDIKVYRETVPDDPSTPGDEQQVVLKCTTDRDLNLRIANALAIETTKDTTYDFQILPFCPLEDSYIQDDGSILIPYNDALTSDTTVIDSGNIIKGYIFAVPSCTFKRQILLSSPITVDDPKFDSITKMYRLNAPNYSAVFEFSAAKNYGLTGFNVRCTYMPVNPYIRVAPIWGGLYGDPSFEDDPRGLICQGDYSLARLNDAWIQYQEQNKNYQAIFDRQIQNMDVMRGFERTEESWNVGAGVLTGIGSGMAAGAMAGSAAGPWGALAGAVVGGITGGVGAGVTGSMDRKMNEAKYQENKSYATDVFGLQLGNIQALPRTLSRTTAFNVDNRYFPVLAIYDCSDSEKEAVKQFIANRSMNVGIIGKPSDYVEMEWESGDVVARGFIRGSIIHIDTIHDSHYIDALNDEFEKGVFMR